MLLCAVGTEPEAFDGFVKRLDLFLPPLDDSSVLIPLPTKDDVYQTALNLRPEIESSKLNIEASDMNIKISRAGYIPSLSLSAGIGTTNANGN